MDEKVMQRAERVFGTPVERHEKGSAMSLIRQETDATRAKSERLKALRLAREANEPAAAAPRKRATETKRPKRGRS
ncbi:transcriptional regulator [Jiella sp. MQZ9-1]|uniref:Transcriptional regulator n=1 Tax=Jiella flava TaxID=2816857 RepID=A0A939JSQ0_9HYPH|nr:transcriptional regulator [Jiella flava]MBO0661325.1 transcriptional regulator [Jiella flava]MCD2469970.1 transcriptional regulator [Jiella flava]